MTTPVEPPVRWLILATGMKTCGIMDYARLLARAAIAGGDEVRLLGLMSEEGGINGVAGEGAAEEVGRAGACYRQREGSMTVSYGAFSPQAVYELRSRCFDVYAAGERPGE